MSDKLEAFTHRVLWQPKPEELQSEIDLLKKHRPECVSVRTFKRVVRAGGCYAYVTMIVGYRRAEQEVKP